MREGQTTHEALLERGYAHRAIPAGSRLGRREILRNGRVVAVLNCFEANDWIRRWDRKVAAMQAGRKP